MVVSCLFLFTYFSFVLGFGYGGVEVFCLFFNFSGQHFLSLVALALDLGKHFSLFFVFLDINSC